MKATKIDWCDSTCNPVVGCSNGCKYCYGNVLNDRFHFVKKWSCPEYFPDKLRALKSKKPKSIFMDSMSDVGNWHLSWFYSTMYDILDNPQHKYIFLTKLPERLQMLLARFESGVEPIPSNVWFGVSATDGGTTIERVKRTKGISFLSVEPILAPIQGIDKLSNLELVIIGAETGRRRDKVVPEPEWVRDVVRQADAAGAAVFMKESLRKIMGAEFRQDRLMWATR